MVHEHPWSRSCVGAKWRFRQESEVEAADDAGGGPAGRRQSGMLNSHRWRVQSHVSENNLTNNNQTFKVDRELDFIRS